MTRQLPDSASVASSFEAMIQHLKEQAFVRRVGSRGADSVLIHAGPNWDHVHFLPFVLPLTTHMRVILFGLHSDGRAQKFSDPTCYHLDLAVDDLMVNMGYTLLCQGCPFWYSM